MIKESQDYINFVGFNTVAVLNKFAQNTSNVVNLLVNKFAAECNARRNYTVAAFDGIDILKNTEEKVEINAHFIREQLVEMGGHNGNIKIAGSEMEILFQSTEDFWQGETADRTRQYFSGLTLDSIKELTGCLDKIFARGLDLVSELFLFEKALPTP